MTMFLLLMASTGFAQDRYESRERELFRKTHQINLDLNEKSVRCSDLGYGNVQLKISVNDLEWISFFDHSNRGEAEPCMTAGMMSCAQFDLSDFPDLGDAFQQQDDVLKRFRALGKVKTQLQQILKETYSMDHQEQTCQRVLEETVETEVDGTIFTHYRSGRLGEFPYDICLQL